jgi:hypothetical protein
MLTPDSYRESMNGVKGYFAFPRSRFDSAQRDMCLLCLIPSINHLIIVRFL